MRTTTRLATLVSASLALLPLKGLTEISIDIGHSTEFSDNAFLSEQNATDKTEHRTWLEGGLKIESQNWKIDGGYRFTNVAVELEDDTFFYPEEEEIAGGTQFYGTALRQRVALDVRHDRRIMSEQPGEREIPTNQQIRDTAAITPTLYLQNNSRQQVFLSALYTRVNYNSLSEGPTRAINNESIGFALTGQRGLSDIDTLGLRLEQVTSSYDTDRIEDNKYSSLVGFYSAELRRLSYSASLGVNRVETRGRETLTDPTASLGLDYTLGTTVIGFFTQYFITDSARGNLAGSQFNLDSDSSEIGSGDARAVDRYSLISNRLSVLHNFTDRTAANLRLEVANEDYRDNDDLDQTNVNFVAELAHIISPRWEVSLIGRVRKTDFERVDTLENTTTGYNAIANYSPTSRMSLRLNWGYRERDSDAPSLSFDEQTITLGVSYDLHP